MPIVTKPNLTNTRTPTANELSADRINEIYDEIGLTDGSDPESINGRLLALEEGAESVPTTRTISTTAPLAGGGDLSANRTLSIAAASAIAAGSMSAAHYSKLEGIASSAAAVGSGVVAVGSSTSDGASASAARVDHVHAHGNQAGGSLHDAASTSVAGFLSAADKTKLDGLSAISVATLSGTSDTADNADSNSLVRCTNSSTVSITIPTGLTPGVTIEYLQEGSGQVRIIAGGGLTLRHNADFLPYTEGQWSSIVVTILDTDEALVRGDLIAA